MPDDHGGDPPDPPEAAPKYILEGLEKQEATTLRAIARYADRLADHREAAAAELEADPVDVGATPDEWDDGEAWADALQEAHEKADLAAGTGTLTTKTIDGRDYYYLQWREGDTVTSQCVAPVAPAGAE